MVHSLASMTPIASMANEASASGREGEATIFAILVSPRPFLTQILVVVACAMMLPPIGFIDGPANIEPPSKFAATTYTSNSGSLTGDSKCVLDL